MGERRQNRILGLLAILTGVIGAALLSASAAVANVDNFSYARWSAEYSVSQNDEGRSVAHVTETLVARFPDFDQNRGIVRGLETRYLGADLHTRVLSITDENGDPVPYTTEREGGELKLLLGTDDFVHGLTTYVIEYEMRDVMIAATESGNDEFYWNLLPLRSSQPIEEFDTSITFSPELSGNLTGQSACYQGRSGSTKRCELVTERLTDGRTQFRTASGPRVPQDGVTVAIGFTAGTITQPPARQPNAVLDRGPYIALGGGILTTIIGGIAYRRMVRRSRTAPEIGVPQFGVPDDLPPLIAAHLVPGSRSAFPAQIVHLAVRGALRIEIPDKSSTPILHIANPERATDPVDQRVLQEFFSTSPTFAIPTSSTSFASRVTSLTKAGLDAAKERGLVTKERSPIARLAFWVTLGIAAVAVAVAVTATMMGRDNAIPALIASLVAGLTIVAFAIYFGSRHTVPTPTGALAYQRLQDMRTFIRGTDADRFNKLQSAENAQRYRAGSVEFVHLYERLLPYAILFGQERSWGPVLDSAYSSTQTSQPWIDNHSNLPFPRMLPVFTRSTQAAATYSPSSSGSGGSSGGGSSGGGGGGGSSGGR